MILLVVMVNVFPFLWYFASGLISSKLYSYVLLKIINSLITGKVTSLVAKKNLMLATRIEEAIKKNESLESLSVDSVRRDVARSRITPQKVSNPKFTRVSNQKSKSRPSGTKYAKTSVQASKSVKAVKPSNTNNSKKAFSTGKRPSENRRSTAVKSTSSKLSVVGFRGRTSWSNKKESSVSN